MFKLLVVVLWCLFAVGVVGGGNESDIVSLMAFKSAITKDPHLALRNWNVKVQFCNWSGIRCNTHKSRVIGVDLKNMGLEGRIASEVGNLSSIRYLDLSKNLFKGHIPWALGRLPLLEQLHLNGNLLEGPIPVSLGRCLRLKELFLSDNFLNLSVPRQLGKLSNLQMLTSWGNHHTGVIPRELGNCSMLRVVDFAGNDLVGTIPPEIGLLSRLEMLSLEQNQLTGQIPPSLLNCTELRNLSFLDNTLTGPIPSDIGVKLTKLENLLLPVNKLNGTIPKSLGNCSRLSVLELAWNELSGVIPQELGNLHALTNLNLFCNRLVGGSASTIPILDALGNCSLLRRLDLTDNYLQGRLSPSVGLLSPLLSTFSLEGNGIGGNIPQEIGNLTGLTEVYLSNNPFHGGIPSTIARLSNLHILNLSCNQLEGPIPMQLGTMKSLEYIFLYSNALSGRIPSSLGDLQQLRQLDLSINKLYGRIPQELGRCKILELLDVSHNRLTGAIPLEVASLGNLQLYFNLSNNQLTGAVPGLLGGMQMVQAIDLSANKLSGSIPNGLSSCAGLMYLNLSVNELQGMVPTSFGQGLKNLEVLDLSFNELTGSLPSSLPKLEMLHHLNLSYNNFLGEVPYLGAYKKKNITSFIGNPQLCGKWLGLRDCSSRKLYTAHKHALKWKLLVVVCIVGVSVLSGLCLGFWICFRNKKKGILNQRTLRSGQLWKMSKDDLRKATEDFNCRNLIGIGSLGSVYRGVLPSGKIVAVKVLVRPNSEESDKCFERECQTLLKVEHPNLLKIISGCSEVDFKALVLEFMPNGSLDRHLHREGDGEVEELSLRKRLLILQEVAIGLSYLHHRCSPPIVHCDIKPQNVLLDETMGARVADFGIAQLLNNPAIESPNPTMTSTLRGSIGYIAPEYGAGGRIWTKGDVYSYGVLVLESITGKRPTDPMFAGELSLWRWVSDSFPNNLQNVIAPSLVAEIVTPNSHSDGDGQRYSTVESLARVGLQCSNDVPHHRPTMAEVLNMIHNIVSSRSR